MSQPRSVWIGFDSRAGAAYAVARHTVKQFAPVYTDVRGVVVQDLILEGVYTRQSKEVTAGPCTQCSLQTFPRLHDVISDAPMATEFAISRFFVPYLVRRRSFPADRLGWAMFCDCDVLVRKPLLPLFQLAEAHPEKALFCVFHDHKVNEGEYKMDKQVQVNYGRKNWSSVMLFNCDHPANDRLTIDLLNSAPGRDLHRFCWLEDDLIGELPAEWNYLVNVSPPMPNPALVHFTLGGPWLPEFRNVPFADEWWGEQEAWAL